MYMIVIYYKTDAKHTVDDVPSWEKVTAEAKRASQNDGVDHCVIIKDGEAQRFYSNGRSFKR